jgi:hypothetical protein
LGCYSGFTYVIIFSVYDFVVEMCNSSFLYFLPYKQNARGTAAATPLSGFYAVNPHNSFGHFIETKNGLN